MIGRIRVVGAQRIDTALVRKLLVSRPGRRYSQEELFQSQRNLYESDLFRFATVNIDSAAYHPGDDSVPLLVQVNEGKRRRIRGGLGYATNDCFRGSLGWTSRDFLGGAEGSAGGAAPMAPGIASGGGGGAVGGGLSWAGREREAHAARSSAARETRTVFIRRGSNAGMLRRPAREWTWRHVG